MQVFLYRPKIIFLNIENARKYEILELENNKILHRPKKLETAVKYFDYANFSVSNSFFKANNTEQIHMVTMI